MIQTSLRFSSIETIIIKNVLERLDTELYGNDFVINRCGNLVLVVSIKAGKNWHFNSKERLLGHFAALHDFTSGTLFELK